MGDIVNLRRARKQRERREQEKAAQAKRVAHGRSKSERELASAQARLEAVKLDAHRRERDADDQA